MGGLVGGGLYLASPRWRVHSCVVEGALPSRLSAGFSLVQV